MNADWIIPDWPAPAAVRALSTTRTGGFSVGPWHSFNLGLRSGDDPAAVARNRALLRSHLPGEPRWLQQVHGARVVGDAVADGSIANPHEVGQSELDQWGVELPEADAQFATGSNQVCVVLSADCLPVLFCNRAGTRIAAAHAGWRGMAAGVLENTVKALAESPSDLLAWLGPAIGPLSYEVGGDVRDRFVGEDAEGGKAFQRRGKAWLFDLYTMARLKLMRAGVMAVSGGKFCTYGEADRFFSYRRDGQTGRMASLVWIEST